MGLFRDYFVTVLRLPFLQAPGPLAMLVDGASGCLDAAREIVLTLRDQFFPARCEDVHLVRFARSRGIVRNPLESEAHWLERVRFAYRWWSMGGRASAMSEALRIGFDFGDVRVVGLNAPFFDETTGAPLHNETTLDILSDGGPDQWAEFNVYAHLQGHEILYTQEQIIWAINEIKPARSKLSQLVLISLIYDETTGVYLFDETTLAPLAI